MKSFTQGLWLTFTFLSMIALGFNDNLRGPLFFEILKDFHLTDLQGAWFFSASSLLGFFASLGAATILKKIHLLQLLVLSLLCMTFALLGLGYFHHYLFFLATSGSLGMSMGFMGVAQNSSISFLTTNESQAKVFSALHSMYALSSVLAPLAVGWGLAHGWVWREFFTASSVVVFSLFVLTLISPYPQWALEHKTVPPPEKNTIRGLGIVSVYMSLALGFYVIAEILVGSRISLYTIRELGLNSEEASHYVTGFYVGLLAGRVLGSFVKWPGHYRHQLYASLTLSFISMLAGLYVNPWWFIGVGLAMSIYYPVFMVYLSDIYHKRIGVMMALAIAIQSISIVCMHQIVGFVSDLAGIKVAFHIGLIFILLSAFFLWRGEVERHKY
jgi:fucose permease